MGATAAVAAAAATAAGAGAPSLEAQPDDSVAIFKRSWEVYQKLLKVDYLEHRGLYAALEAFLMRQWGGGSSSGGGSADVGGGGGSGGRPLAMLDLGCGDAMQIAASLRRCGAPAAGLPLASYTGVDLSPPALALARRHLAFLQPRCAVRLVEQDLAAFVAGCPPQQYDLVFASFAVHHLSEAGKASFVAAAARCLAPGGCLVLVDIFLRDGEDRGAFMGRYKANMQEAVDAGIISRPEADLLLGHILHHDHPEQLSTYRRFAAAAGLAPPECLHTDSKEFGRLVVMRRSQADGASS